MISFQGENEEYLPNITAIEKVVDCQKHEIQMSGLFISPRVESDAEWLAGRAVAAQRRATLPLPHHHTAAIDLPVGSPGSDVTLTLLCIFYGTRVPLCSKQ